MMEKLPKEECNLSTAMKLIRLAEVDENNSSAKSELDILFDNYEKANKEAGKPESMATKCYKEFRIASGKTLKSVLITTMTRLSAFDYSNVASLLKRDELHLEELGRKKQVLFIIIPTWSMRFLNAWTHDHMILNLAEGALRMLIFLGYITAISSMKDIQRVFQYHGAEHKTIYTYEAGLPLEVANVRQFSTLHPRCGTNFLMIVMLISMFAWVFRFGLFGFGDPGSGLWMLILSMIVYGMAFDFFNISGSLFVEQETSSNIRASAQGLFFMMTNGLGAIIGGYASGAVVDAFSVYADGKLVSREWPEIWLIFAAYALVIGILFALVFKYKHRPEEAVNKK